MSGRHKFVIPGIIDAHDHATRLASDIVYPDKRRGLVLLQLDITTRYDRFTRTKIVFPLSDLVETGRLSGPRTYGYADAIVTTTLGGDP